MVGRVLSRRPDRRGWRSRAGPDGGALCPQDRRDERAIPALDHEAAVLAALAQAGVPGCQGYFRPGRGGVALESARHADVAATLGRRSGRGASCATRPHGGPSRRSPRFTPRGITAGSPSKLSTATSRPTTFTSRPSDARTSATRGLRARDLAREPAQRGERARSVSRHARVRGSGGRPRRALRRARGRLRARRFDAPRGDGDPPAREADGSACCDARGCRHTSARRVASLAPPRAKTLRSRQSPRHSSLAWPSTRDRPPETPK